MDAPFRDNKNEDHIQQIIYTIARGEDSSGEDNFSSQFLNDSGEGLEFEEREKAKCPDRKSTRLNSSHSGESRMPSSA